MATHGALFGNRDGITLQLLTRAENRLRITCTRSLVAAINAASASGELTGETGHERYLDFLTTFTAERLGETFPLLHSAVGHLIRNTAAAFGELCERLSADRQAIAETFGIACSDAVTSIGQADGDAHAHGRSVSILTFASGARLAYKPRDISCEAAYEEIVTHVNRHAGTSLPAARALECGGYGYVEYVQAEDVSDISPQFMKSCGELAAVFLLLDARDMHFENIVATRRGPVPVDLETLMHPARVHVGPRPEAEGNAYDVIARSLYGIGILPLVMAGKDEDSGHVDLGFLGGENKGTSPFKGLVFENPFTDKIKVVLRAEEAGQRSTVVQTAGEEDIQHLAEEMADGFATTARALARGRDAWTEMLTRVARGMRVRYVHNPTALYAQSLRMAASAAAMAAPATSLGLLKRIAITSKTSDRGIIAAELRQMSERDVPYFAAEATGTVLYDADGNDTGARLPQTPLARALEKAAELDESTIGQQLTLLHSAFCSRFPDNHLTGTTTWQAEPATSHGGSLHDVARHIADNLVASGLPDKFAHLPRTWIGPLASAQAERVWPCGVLGYDLYTGRTGPALALAAAGRVLGDETYRGAARQIFATSAEILAGQRYEQRSVQQTGPGAYTGLTGLLFALDTAGRLLEEPGWRQAAQDAVPLAVEGIEGERAGADVIGGIAGTATMLAAVGGPHAAQALPGLTKMLCTMVEGGHGSWFDQSGFAHGVAGLLHALSVLRPHTGDQDLRRQVDTAIGLLLDRLAVFYDTVEDNWFSNIGAPDRFSTGWCHGAAGISLALLACVEHTGNERARTWLGQALTNTVEQGFGRNLTWCHGDLGNHDVLSDAAARLGDGQLAGQVSAIEDTLLRPDVFLRKGADSRSRYAHTNSIMVGTSGVLLHLLNRISPGMRLSPLSLTGGARG
ncbi:type 2 lanthipeptide synthetase LanM family protein [Streptomyces glebosus]|uniref:type 2 lanthipeptide synthetase LanM family protein n=1 Tax=Streptomyces glebosus TaxID=249580 RepID=UPI001E3E60F6|nr:type 2 lanthipeptide synthetase LanM family protein [Streptomyces glebosus]